MAYLSSEYCKDESGLTGHADARLTVRDLTDIRQLFSRSDIGRMTIQGSRTGISGAAVPAGGTVVDVSTMSGVLSCGENAEGKYMDVLAGTTLEEVQKATPAGWFFACEPTETSATIGGMYALNAGGPGAGHYKPMGQHVLEADVIFPNFGEMTITRGQYVFDENGCLMIGDHMLQVPEITVRTVLQLTPVKGMDLLDLLAGSEGMLGVFERLRLRLTPVPNDKWNFLFFFGREEDALAYADDIARRAQTWDGCDLTAADYINHVSLNIYRKYAQDFPALASVPGIPENRCVVMMEIVSAEQSAMEDVLETLLVSFESFGGSDEDTWAGNVPDECRRIHRFRHGIPECINHHLNLVHCNGRKMSADIRLPANDPQTHLKSIIELTGTGCAVTAHILQSIYHVDLLFDSETSFQDALSRRKQVWRYAVEQGGVLAAENGIGKGKISFEDDFIRDEQREVMRQVKQFFDSRGILNPGNMM